MMPNSRLITLRSTMKVFIKMLFWLPVFIFSFLLVINTVPYFTFDKDFSFIQERSLLFQRSIYNSSFYIHIFAGAICIITALIQFSRLILKKARDIHRWSGRLYVFVVLFLGAPTGLYMAFFAKGTIAERSLFLFMALAWFFTTLLGLTTILRKNVIAHKIWMIRSYAMAMTAVTFRIYHIIFYLVGWDHLKNYELSLWISVIGNMVLAEYFIYRKSRSYVNSFNLK